MLRIWCASRTSAHWVCLVIFASLAVMIGLAVLAGPANQPSDEFWSPFKLVAFVLVPLWGLSHFTIHIIFRILKWTYETHSPWRWATPAALLLILGLYALIPVGVPFLLFPPPAR